jgi:hypothetical protein
MSPSSVYRSTQHRAIASARDSDRWAIREVSMFHGFGPEGVFDFEDESLI